jgi:hypothetical protein
MTWVTGGQIFSRGASVTTCDPWEWPRPPSRSLASAMVPATTGVFKLLTGGEAMIRGRLGLAILAAVAAGLVASVRRRMVQVIRVPARHACVSGLPRAGRSAAHESGDEGAQNRGKNCAFPSDLTPIRTVFTSSQALVRPNNYLNLLPRPWLSGASSLAGSRASLADTCLARVCDHGRSAQG